MKKLKGNVTHFLERNFVCVDKVMGDFIGYNTLQFRMDGTEQRCRAKIFNVKVAQLGHVDLDKSENECYLHLETTVKLDLFYFCIELKLGDVSFCQYFVHGQQVAAKTAHRARHKVLCVHHRITSQVTHNA